MILDKLRRTLNTGLKSITWNGSGNWVDSDAPGNLYSSPVGMRQTWIPGQHWNYASLVGPLIANSAYMACLGAYLDAFTEAPPTAKKICKDGKHVTDPDHPLTELLLDLGHDDYDASTLWDCTIADYLGHGNAYWLPVWDKQGNPRELRYVPHCQIKPIFPQIPSLNGPPIEYYEYTVGVKRYQVPVEEVINFQWGAQPDNPYLGIGRGDQLIREIFQDNTAGEYSGAVLKNMGIMGRIISPKDVDNARGFDERVVVDTMAEQSKGEKRGSDVAFNRALDIFEPSATPEKMALDKIRQYPESRVCAVMRVPQQVAGLLVGNTGKTYNNYPEARAAFWEESLLPMMRRMGGQGSTQLVHRSPEFGKKIWMGFNYEEVRALKEDVVARDENVRENFKVGLIDAAEAREGIGKEAVEGDKGRMFAPPVDPNAQQDEPAGPDGKPITPANAKKMIDDEYRVNSWIARIESELEAMETTAASNGTH